MDIKTISVSSSDTWQTCALKYKYRYIEKIPSPEPTNEYFVFGKMIHSIIERYTKDGGDIEAIKKEVMESPLELSKTETVVPIESLSREYVHKTKVHVDAFLKLHKIIGPGGDIEVRFDYDLDPPHGKMAIGYIDRLIINGDSAIIIDYKTSKNNRWRKTKKTVAKDMQLRVYALVVWKMYGIDPRNIKAALYYLDGEQLVGATFSERTLIDTHKTMLSTFNRIEATNPDTVYGRVGEHCRRCDYRNHCPFYNLNI